MNMSGHTPAKRLSRAPLRRPHGFCGGAALLLAIAGSLVFSASAFAAKVEFKPESPETTHEFTVPAGVSQIEVTAVGGAGQPGEGGSGAKGTGAKVTAVLPVHAGESLYAVFGGEGKGGAYSGISGGAGGGASDLRTEAASLGSRLVVAGGGGGGGGGEGVGDGGAVVSEGGNGGRRDRTDGG